MIGYWHHHVVRPSVCLSVCAAVPYSSQGCCTGLNLYQRVPSRQVPIFVPSGILYSCCDLHFLSMSQRVWFIYRLVTSSTGSFFVSATTIIWPLPLYLTTWPLRHHRGHVTWPVPRSIVWTKCASCSTFISTSPHTGQSPGANNCSSGKASGYVISHLGQLSLLPSVGW